MTVIFHRSVVNRINSELANDLGNLAQRSLSMVGRYCGGILPAPGDLVDPDEQILGHAEQLIHDVRSHIDAQAFHEALEVIWGLVRAANAYVDARAVAAS